MKNQNQELAEYFVEGYFCNCPDMMAFYSERITELLNTSQKPLIDILTQIHSALFDKSKLTLIEQSWFDAIEKLNVIDKKETCSTPLMNNILNKHYDIVK